MGSVIVSPEPDRDLLELWRYIPGDTVDSADQMVGRFADSFARTARFPYSGEKYQRGEVVYKQIIVKPYMVFYRVLDNEQVEIVRIFHGAHQREDLLQ